MKARPGPRASLSLHRDGGLLGLVLGLGGQGELVGVVAHLFALIVGAGDDDPGVRFGAPVVVGDPVDVLAAGDAVGKLSPDDVFLEGFRQVLAVGASA